MNINEWVKHLQTGSTTTGTSAEDVKNSTIFEESVCFDGKNLVGSKRSSE